MTVLDAHLSKREPEPGLINLPIPLPSVPVLSPLLSPLVGGAQPASPPKPTSAPKAPPVQTPSPPPPSSPPPSPPPPSSPSIPSSPSGGNGGGSTSSSGGGSGSGGNSGSNTPPDSGSNGGASFPPPSSGGDDGATSGGSISQGNSGSSPPSGSTPASPASSDTEGPLSVSGGTTFRVTPTGVVALPLNNANSTPSNGSSSDVGGQGGGQDASGQSTGATTGRGVSVTPVSSQGITGSSHAGVGGAPGGNGNGGDGSGSVPGGTDPAASSSSHSRLSAGAVGGIAAVVVVACLALILFVLRKRYTQRKAERQVEWINGYVSEGVPNMQQRGVSMRSSWGTPIEHRFSDPFQLRGDSPTDFTRNTRPLYGYENHSTEAPVLPMPVHSPTEDCSRSPEDPFADVIPPAEPLKRMSSLPIRVSLISSGSGDPFEDAYAYIRNGPDPESEPTSPMSNATFGPGRSVATRTQANFPMPPPTAGSGTTTFAIGSPEGFLQPPTPSILLSFPDSPISPTFAASGTSTYPRRASVKLQFQPSQERHDELQLEKGDQVTVVSVYEDGWAFVQNDNNNERGLVPLHCLEIDNP